MPGELVRRSYHVPASRRASPYEQAGTAIHAEIVPVPLFERVQEVLDSGIRTRKHHHYLKSVFWCNRCDSRFGLAKAKGNGGIYYYFFCHASRRHECDQPYVLPEDLERKTEKYYARVKLSESFRQAVL